MLQPAFRELPISDNLYVEKMVRVILPRRFVCGLYLNRYCIALPIPSHQIEQWNIAGKWSGNVPHAPQPRGDHMLSDLAGELD